MLYLRGKANQLPLAAYIRSKTKPYDTKYLATFLESETETGIEINCQSAFTCDVMGITGCQGRWRGDCLSFHLAISRNPDAVTTKQILINYCTNSHTLLIRYWILSETDYYAEYHLFFYSVISCNPDAIIAEQILRNFWANIYAMLIKYWKISQNKY